MTRTVRLLAIGAQADDETLGLGRVLARRFSIMRRINESRRTGCRQ